MENIFHLDKKALFEFVDSINVPTYRVTQIWEGLYKNYYQRWEEFTSIPRTLQRTLSDEFIISPLTQEREFLSKDHQTIKVLFKMGDSQFIETVHLRNNNRNTICISTQSGCPVGCKFCATGAAGFFRNLSMPEIISQVAFFANALKKNDEKITNIVLMGMGEPFLNYEATLQAINLLNNPDCFDIGARRITVSTIGIPDKIDDFAEIGKQYNLAISLHAPNDQIRKKLIPIANKISLEEIIASAQNYIRKTNRRITYEYILIKYINAEPDHAYQLVKLLGKQNCHVNLIALNKNSHFSGEPPSNDEIHNFSRILLKNQIPTTIRNSQGSKIQAGCGQLAGNKR